MDEKEHILVIHFKIKSLLRTSNSVIFVNGILRRPGGPFLERPVL